MKESKIIIIVGAHATGKTSLCNEINVLFDCNYVDINERRKCDIALLDGQWGEFYLDMLLEDIKNDIVKSALVTFNYYPKELISELMFKGLKHSFFDLDLEPLYISSLVQKFNSFGILSKKQKEELGENEVLKINPVPIFKKSEIALIHSELPKFDLRLNEHNDEPFYSEAAYNFVKAALQDAKDQFNDYYQRYNEATTENYELRNEVKRLNEVLSAKDKYIQSLLDIKATQENLLNHYRSLPSTPSQD